MVKNKIIYHYDISKSGKDYIGLRDISIITNEQAVLESVKNILNTEQGERIMRPDFGCSLNKYLFEPLDIVTTTLISKTIRDSVNKFEPRIENLQVIVNPDEINNTYEISVIFNMKTISKDNKSIINITLNKIR